MLLIPLSWISLTGENSGIEMSSSLEAGLKEIVTTKTKSNYLAKQLSLSIIELPADSPDLHGLHLITSLLHI